MHATPAAIPSSTPATKPAVFYRPQGNEVALFEHAYPSTHVKRYVPETTVFGIPLAA
jgi:hypothetical protein